MEVAMPLDLTIKHEQNEPDEEDSEQGLYFLSDDSDNTTLPWNESPTNRGFSDESISSPQNPFYEEEFTNQEDTSSSSDESLNSFSVIVGEDGILKTVPHGGIKTENIVMANFEYYEEKIQNRKKKTNALAKTMLLLGDFHTDKNVKLSSSKFSSHERKEPKEVKDKLIKVYKNSSAPEDLRNILEQELKESSVPTITCKKCTENLARCPDCKYLNSCLCKTRKS